MFLSVSKYCGLSNVVPLTDPALLLLRALRLDFRVLVAVIRRFTRGIAMTLVHAFRLMAETFGGAALMLGAVWMIVTVEEQLRLLVGASQQLPAPAGMTGMAPATPQAPPSTP